MQVSQAVTSDEIDNIRPKSKETRLTVVRRLKDSERAKVKNVQSY